MLTKFCRILSVMGRAWGLWALTGVGHMVILPSLSLPPVLFKGLASPALERAAFGLGGTGNWEHV